MKKYIYFSLVIFSFCFINVKAVNNDSLDLTISDGYFFSLSSYPSYTNNGFTLTTYTVGDIFNVALPSPTFVYGVNGGALSQCGMSFVKDFYYSVSYFFVTPNNSSYLHPWYSSWNSSLKTVGICNSANCIPSFHHDNVNSGVNLVTYTGSSGDTFKIGSFTVIFKAPTGGTCVSLAFSSNNNNTSASNLWFLGYKYQSLGSASLSESDIKSALSSDFSNLSNKIDDMKSEQEKTNSKLDSTNSKIDNTNSKLDEIKDMQPDNSDNPDSSKYDDYSSAEDSLLDKANSADLDSVDIPIDSDTSNFIWDTMSSLFSTHPLVFSTMLALLSVGVIKLVLGR